MKSTSAGLTSASRTPATARPGGSAPRRGADQLDHARLPVGQPAEVAGQRVVPGQQRPRRPRLPTSPAEVPMSATPYTRSANSSGRCSASAMIVMPPMEWPTSTTGPSPAACRAVRRGRGRAGRSCWTPRSRGLSGVAALVVEDLADPWLGESREGLALEVPAAAVEREAVHEHDGQRGFAAVGRVDLLDGQRDAVLGDHRVPRSGRSSPKARRRLVVGVGARLRATPTAMAVPAAATPIAPPTARRPSWTPSPR